MDNNSFTSRGLGVMISEKKSSEVLKHAPGIAACLSCFNNLAAKLHLGLKTEKVK